MNFGLLAKLFFAIVVEWALFAAVLFLSAGTLNWPLGWDFLNLIFGVGIVISILLFIKSPSLIADRLKPPVRKNQLKWDKVLLAFLILILILWLVSAGLDKRFGWTSVPSAWVWVGAVGVVCAIVASSLPMFVNEFADVAVEVKEDQKVISSGPYAIVRHPLYAGALLFPEFSGLLLGSWVATVTGLAITIGLIVRTALEDQELQRSLPGYKEYA